VKVQAVIVFLAIVLASCTTTVTPVSTGTPVAPTSTVTLEITPASTPSPMPTQPTFAVIMPDAIQVEKWKEYQAELAKAITCDSGHDCPGYEYALCEWDILRQSGQEVYVWALCYAPHAGNRKPAVIHLEADRSIRNVEVPIGGSSWDSDLLRLFPADVREKLDLYYFLTCPYCGRPEILRIHLQYRLTHPDEPPLIILSATPTATPMPRDLRSS
jgi:hypothetical protein